MRIPIRILALALLIPSLAAAQSKLTENTLKLDEGAEPAAASIEDFAWLSGRWTGEGLGGTTEEVWGAPANGTMMGMFRLDREGKPVFYELLTIASQEGRFTMRLKHVNPDMTGWEEKEKFVEFPWIGTIDGVHHFGGLAFRQEGDEMTIYLALRGKEGVVREHQFRMRRS